MSTVSNKPAKILKTILNLIEKDIKRIQANTNNNQNLDIKAVDALTMQRYVSTLLDIEKAQENNKQKAKRNIDSLPTEELIKQYQRDTKKY